ncbi:helix-turn-helix domain-containing protein [Sorangium sp. So ce693]|uniref:helix-turn-helix domain-containing protein n=1 Tax=Sorangium sp. So ce693 TaxID=3133318 RepID=UPI003F5D8EB1
MSRVRGRRLLEPAGLITIAEAAKLLGMSLPTMRRWDESGKFPARRHRSPRPACTRGTR